LVSASSMLSFRIEESSDLSGGTFSMLS